MWVLSDVADNTSGLLNELLTKSRFLVIIPPGGIPDIFFG